jgi:hypothetical protein
MMPDTGDVILPYTLKVSVHKLHQFQKEVYSEFTTDTGMTVALSYFCGVWRLFFSSVKIRKFMRFAICDTCLSNR